MFNVKKVEIIPVKLCSFFCLEEKDVDQRPEIQKNYFSGQNLQRGTDVDGNYWDYYQPSSNFKLIGLNVSQKYGDDIWLQTDSEGGGAEWAVGFHGIRSIDPNKVAGSIAQNGFKKGPAQAYAGDLDVGPNSKDLGKNCGHGIYLAPKVEICKGDNFTKGTMCYTRPVQFENKWYIVLMMCRINPKKIRVPDGCDRQYYIINQTEDIRPYRIIYEEITDS